MSLTVLTVTGLAHWASYFVNGDDSGLESADKADADEWFDALLREHPLAENVTVVDCGESFTARFDGLLSDVTEYTVHVHTHPEVQLPKVEYGAARRVIRALGVAITAYDRYFAETAEQARGDMPLVERARLENLAAQYRRDAANFRDALAEVLAALPMGAYRAKETNGEGLTWEEWKAAARVSDAKEYRLAWRRGEDPTEWVAR